MISNTMGGRQGVNRNNDAVAAADRHELEMKEGLSNKVQTMVAELEADYPLTHRAIIALIEQLT